MIGTSFGNMLIYYGHLPPADTGTNITHAVVVPNVRVLVMRRIIAGLGSIKHGLFCLFRRTTNQSTPTRSWDGPGGWFVRCLILFGPGLHSILLPGNDQSPRLMGLVLRFSLCLELGGYYTKGSSLPVG